MITMRLLFIIFSVVALLLFARLWIGQGGYPDIWFLEKQIATQNKLNDLQSGKNRKLEAEVSNLKSGDDAIEEYARDELGMIRKGETFYHVILDEKQSVSAQPTEIIKEGNLE